VRRKPRRRIVPELGAIAIMPVVPRFSDRTGPGKIVPAGTIPFPAGLIRRSQHHLRLSNKGQAT
jgi:hypothetical protein